MNMPNCDGVRAAEEMRSLISRGVCPETPIVALSAACSPEEKERCRRAGIVAHLAKPLRLEMLSVLDGILSDAREKRARRRGRHSARRTDVAAAGGTAAAAAEPPAEGTAATSGPQRAGSSGSNKRGGGEGGGG